jgi:long-chain acyl-CoA synthetase
MGTVTSENPNMSILQRLATSDLPLVKEYGLPGIIGALLLAIVIPILLSSVFSKKSEEESSAC